MTTVTIVVLIVIVLLGLLATGGSIAQRRRLARNRPVFEASLDEVNAELAAARAQDRGWERGTLEAAAREAFAAERPGSSTTELSLARIVDRPGTEEDKAIFRVGDTGEQLTLGRRDGAWVLEALG
jgi:CHASE1-domain containing sensor protein